MENEEENIEKSPKELEKEKNEKIYRRLTMNLQNKMSKFREGRSTKDRLNNQLIITISSLCKFLRKNEEEKIIQEQEREIRKKKQNKVLEELKKIKELMLEQERKDKEKRMKNQKKEGKKLKTNKLSEEMDKLRTEKGKLDEQLRNLDKEEKDSQNQTILDLFVPYSRLAKSLQNKLDSLNEEIPEEEDEGDDLNLDEEQPNLNNNLESGAFDNLIADEDADEQNMDDDLNANTDFLNNDNLSISMSLYQKPVGFDEFKSGDTYLKNQKDSTSSTSDKDLIKQSKSNELFIPDDNKEEQQKLANEEFKNILRPKEIKDTVNEMGYDYIKYMYNLFEKMKKKSEENVAENNNQTKTLNFINQFKSFILDIGISDKKFYEQCIREIIYNKTALQFGEFLEVFKKLLNLKFDQIFLKYKFLLNIVERENEEYYSKEELERYYNLIYNCKKINENEIQEEIRIKLLSRYKKFFPKSDKINTRKLSLVLEHFFDIK